MSRRNALRSVNGSTVCLDWPPTHHPSAFPVGDVYRTSVSTAEARTKTN